MAKYPNIHAALLGELRHLLKHGTVVPSRNGKTLEVLARKITLWNPQQRFHLLPGRNANPFAQVAETLWVLGGRNDIKYLAPYLSHAPEFSDDGETWRAGYGPRLRNWWETVDQVENVLDLLHADPTSRRAVISLWDPSQDYAETRDVPCNNWIQFLSRDGWLDMHIVTRSNDIMWGWSGINAFEWSVLHEAVAVDLGLSMGYATFFTGSFHLYKRHWEKAKRIVAATESAGAFYPSSLGETTSARITSGWPRFSLELARVLEYVDDLHATGFEAVHRPHWTLERTQWDPFLQQCATMLTVHTLATLPNFRAPLVQEQIRDNLSLLEGEARVVSQEWLFRKGLITESGATGEADSRARELRGDAVTDEEEGRDAGATCAATPKPAETRSDAVAEAVAAAETLRLAVPGTDPVSMEQISATLAHLEAAKSRSYGDSWKKYGERLSIFPNICRKVDRIEAILGGAAPTSDETLLDTVADCAVYAIKYLGWQLEQRQFNVSTLFLDVARHVLQYAEMKLPSSAPNATLVTCSEDILDAAATLRRLLYEDASITLQDFNIARHRATSKLAYASLRWLEITARETPGVWNAYAAAVVLL